MSNTSLVDRRSISRYHCSSKRRALARSTVIAPTSQDSHHSAHLCMPTSSTSRVKRRNARGHHTLPQRSLHTLLPRLSRYLHARNNPSTQHRRLPSHAHHPPVLEQDGHSSGNKAPCDIPEAGRIQRYKHSSPGLLEVGVHAKSDVRVPLAAYSLLIATARAPVRRGCCLYLAVAACLLLPLGMSRPLQ